MQALELLFILRFIILSYKFVDIKLKMVNTTLYRHPHLSPCKHNLSQYTFLLILQILLNTVLQSTNANQLELLRYSKIIYYLW